MNLWSALATLIANNQVQIMFALPVLFIVMSVLTLVVVRKTLAKYGSDRITEAETKAITSTRMSLITEHDRAIKRMQEDIERIHTRVLTLETAERLRRIDAQVMAIATAVALPQPKFSKSYMGKEDMVQYICMTYLQYVVDRDPELRAVVTRALEEDPRLLIGELWKQRCELANEPAPFALSQLIAGYSEAAAHKLS